MSRIACHPISMLLLPLVVVACSVVSLLALGAQAAPELAAPVPAVPWYNDATLAAGVGGVLFVALELAKPYLGKLNGTRFGDLAIVVTAALVAGTAELVAGVGLLAAGKFAVHQLLGAVGLWGLQYAFTARARAAAAAKAKAAEATAAYANAVLP